jgi:hypothetical protein
VWRDLVDDDPDPLDGDVEGLGDGLADGFDESLEERRRAAGEDVDPNEGHQAASSP